MQLNETYNNSKQQIKPWVVWLARFGYAAKGIVYLIIGGLALQAALGSGGGTTGKRGALVEIITNPYGQILLGLVAAGLIGYVLWRFVQAVKDPDNKGSDAKGIVTRIGYAVSGLIYAGLALVASQLIIGSRGDGNSKTPRDWTADLLAAPYGRWIVGLIGVVIIGFAFYQFYQTYSARFRQYFKLGEMSVQQEKWATYAGRIGFATRGIVQSIIGGFLVVAAWQYDASEAGGLGKALQTLAQQPHGPWLLGCVAAGLIAYGIYSLVLARYRRIYIF
jgi:hypothetical protein